MLNKTMWMTVLATLASVAMSSVAFAADGGMGYGEIGLGAGLALALGVLGGALGQGRVAAAALEGIGRNPESGGKMFLPLILGLVFIESLVIYALVAGVLLVGRIPEVVAH